MTTSSNVWHFYQTQIHEYLTKDISNLLTNILISFKHALFNYSKHLYNYLLPNNKHYLINYNYFETGTFIFQETNWTAMGVAFSHNIANIYMPLPYEMFYRHNLTNHNYEKGT